MVHESPGHSALDYYSCRHGRSKLAFRGPARDLSQPYVAVLGGTETYGKFVARPYAAGLESLAGLAMVNLGCPHAGPDVLLTDPAILDIAAGARATVLQMPGAKNLSNRFYAVHPRRNDRFLRAHPEFQALFPEVDFTEFHFTRHMVNTLAAHCPDRFASVAQELRRSWAEKMTGLMAALPGPVLLFYLSDRAPPPLVDPAVPIFGPCLVDSAMIDQVRALATAYAEVILSPAARGEGVSGMEFLPHEFAAAAELPGPAAHREIAAQLWPHLERMLD